VSQGETRRGQFAGYIDIEHDDLEEWLNIKTEGDPIQDIFYGVIIGDEWFQAMVDGDEAKREKWAKIIETRINIGVPYIIFRDNMNEGKPQVYKDKDYEINASNLCTEIALPATPMRACLLPLEYERPPLRRESGRTRMGRDADALPRRRDGGVHSEGRGDRSSWSALCDSPSVTVQESGVPGWHSYLQRAT